MDASRGVCSIRGVQIRGLPVKPTYGGAPSTKMIAHYDNYCENFEVDSWERGKGFILNLDHEPTKTGP